MTRLPRVATRTLLGTLVLVACGAPAVESATPVTIPPSAARKPATEVAQAGGTTVDVTQTEPSSMPGDKPGEKPEAARPRPEPKEVGARHVLVQYMGAERAPAAVVRSRNQAEALALKVLARARRGESFIRLVTEYSDEPGAAGRGGALGKFGRGRMVPAFDAAVFALDVGELSGLVETPFGFHVILRTE